MPQAPLCQGMTYFSLIPDHLRMPAGEGDTGALHRYIKFSIISLFCLTHLSHFTTLANLL